MGVYDIRLIEEHEAVNFYSIMLEGEELTELEKFFDKFRLTCKVPCLSYPKIL